jgi:hypothetical protein
MYIKFQSMHVWRKRSSAQNLGFSPTPDLQVRDGNVSGYNGVGYLPGLEGGRQSCAGMRATVWVSFGAWLWLASARPGDGKLEVGT